MNTAPTQTQNTADKKTLVTIGDFGNGRYSPAMGELYRDSQRLLGFNELQAHVTAARLGIDAGQLSAGKVTISFGKSVSKDGKRTLKEVTKGMKLSNSWAMSIGAVCSQLDDARKQGLEVVECTMAKEIMAFVNDSANRIEAKPKE